VPLLFIVGTGVIMSYTWANNLLYRISGSEVPAAGNPSSQNATHGRHRPTALVDSATVEALFRRAESRLRDWKTLSLRWPLEGTRAVFSIDESNSGHPDKRAQLTLDAGSGDVRQWEPFSSYSAGR
jgi:hypothetical protein